MSGFRGFPALALFGLLSFAPAASAAHVELIGPGARGTGDEAVPAAGPGQFTGRDIDVYMRGVVKTAGLKGAAVIIGRCTRDGGFADVVRGYYGDYTPDTAEPIASVTKWYSAMTLATLADRGRLRFDDPIARYLPGAPADKRAITVRQTMAHTSGLADLPIEDEQTHADLAASTEHVLGLPLKGAPGSVFVYSGTAMQVGGRVAEIAGGADFRTLFRKQIAEPLGLRRTTFSAFTGGKGAPALGGDMVSTPAELERFTQMVAGRGKWRGRRIVSAGTLADMQQLISADAAPMSVPRMAQRFPGMGTGMWCERVMRDGRCVSVAAIGAYGSYTWVDYDHGLYGVMFVKDDPTKILRAWRAVRAAAEQSVTRSGVTKC